jgi:hypothetical protein
MSAGNFPKPRCSSSSGQSKFSSYSIKDWQILLSFGFLDDIMKLPFDSSLISDIFWKFCMAGMTFCLVTTGELSSNSSYTGQSKSLMIFEGIYATSYSHFLRLMKFGGATGPLSSLVWELIWFLDGEIDWW